MVVARTAASPSQRPRDRLVPVEAQRGERVHGYPLGQEGRRDVQLAHRPGHDEAAFVVEGEIHRYDHDKEHQIPEGEVRDHEIRRRPHVPIGERYDHETRVPENSDYQRGYHQRHRGVTLLQVTLLGHVYHFREIVRK